MATVPVRIGDIRGPAPPEEKIHEGLAFLAQVETARLDRHRHETDMMHRRLVELEPSISTMTPSPPRSPAHEDDFHADQTGRFARTGDCGGDTDRDTDDDPVEDLVDVCRDMRTRYVVGTRVVALRPPVRTGSGLVKLAAALSPVTFSAGGMVQEAVRELAFMAAWSYTGITYSPLWRPALQWLNANRSTVAAGATGAVKLMSSFVSDMGKTMGSGYAEDTVRRRTMLHAWVQRMNGVAQARTKQALVEDNRLTKWRQHLDAVRIP